MMIARCRFIAYDGPAVVAVRYENPDRRRRVAAGRPARHHTRTTRVCGRRCDGRKARRLSRQHRAIRRGHSRSRVAADRRADAARALARRRNRGAGAGSHRPRKLERESTRHRRRRGRLRHQAIPDRGAAGEAARADPASERTAHARAAERRGGAGSANVERHSRWAAGEADQSRASRALVSHAPSRPHRFTDRADRAHLRADVRPGLEHRRGLHRASQTEARRLDDRNRPRTRLSHPDGIVKGSLRTRLFVGALVWMTAVFVAVTALLLKITRNHPEFAMPSVTYHTAMGIFAGAFIVGGLFLVQKALAPFRALRAGLTSVREGRSQRIEGDHPSEVQPLVNDLNALLEDRERAIARALTTAGDLAHGLKTPLAVLAQEAEQAGAAGHHDLATTLGQLVERMQRQVDYHLARARATASARAAPGLRCSVLPSVEGLVRTMRRLHAERELRIDADVSPAHEIRGRREDLDEM